MSKIFLPKKRKIASLGESETANDFEQDLEVEFVESIARLDAKEWNRLMGDANPFNRHEYLAALESSQCACLDTGWAPLHLVLRQGPRRLAVMPLYVKSHSYGEYVFDWAWAEAYERHQVPYYPKLLCAIPFTPVTGNRLGICSGLTDGQRQLVWQAVAQALNFTLTEYGFSSWHCLFLGREQHVFFSRQGNLRRLGTQFHWQNRGYACFDDFLASLNSRRRKTVRKERAKLRRQGLRFVFVEGEHMDDASWREFYLCYQLTYQKHSGHCGYLNLEFFKSIGLSMPAQILLLRVESPQGQLIATALYFKTGTRLYGRYWGCLAEVDGLHFEACYYQGIEYCIRHGLQTFDAGAQGEHKVFRGFEPVETYSNHEIAHPAFRDAIGKFTLIEADNTRRYMQALAKKLPFRPE